MSGLSVNPRSIPVLPQAISGTAGELKVAPPRLELDPISGTSTLVVGSVRVGGIRTAERPELVPSSFVFHDSAAHTVSPIHAYICICICVHIDICI